MKNKKGIVLGFILGIIMMSGVGVVAAIFNAEDISFTPTDEAWKVTNVKEAMDSLYDLADSNEVVPMEVKTNGEYSYSVRYTRTYENIGWTKVTYTEGNNIQYVMVVPEGGSLHGSNNISVGTSVDVSQYDRFTIYVQGLTHAQTDVYANFLFE